MQMENEEGKIHIIKHEKAIVPNQVQELANALQGYHSEYDERFIEHIGKSMGFVSSDDKV